jgi:hypothetical protein
MPTHVIPASPADRALESTADSWAAALAGTGTLTLRGATQQFAPVGVGNQIDEQFEVVPADYGVGVLFLEFDTSAIGPGDDITGISLELNNAGRFYGADDFDFEVYAYDWGDGEISVDDWLTPDDLAGMTLVASWPASAWTGNNTYYAFTLTEAFRAAIVRGGKTRLVVVTSHHRLGTEPTDGEWYIMTWATGDAWLAPRLTVETLAQGQSDAAVEALLAAHTDVVRVILVTIDHPEFTDPIRVTSDAVETVRTGDDGPETYVPFPFELRWHPDGPDEIGRARIRIHCDREILARVREVQRGALLVTVGVVLASDPDSWQLGPLEFECDTIPWDAQWIDAVLSIDSDLHDAWPYTQFTPATTPGLWL